MTTDAVRYMEGLDQPPRQPLAIVAFGGWVDAATAATGAVRYLVNALEARKVAEIDPEDFYSFTDTRPLTSNTAPGERVTHWPTGEFQALSLPAPEERDLLLFVAPEPNLRWRGYANAMLDVLERFGASGLICLGSIFGAIHHRATVPLTGWATDPTYRSAMPRNNVTFTNYEGPTGFVTALLDEAQKRKVPAGAIFGFTPNYIQGVPNPRVSSALLRATAAVTGVNLPLADLERAGRGLMRQVDRLLADQPELREQVERILRLTGGTVEESKETEEAEPAEGSPTEERPEGSVELPSPEAFVREMEEYLRQLRGPDVGPSSQGGNLT